MRILFLTRRFHPDIGGGEKHVFEVSKELIKRGHKVTIITESSAHGGSRNCHSIDQSDTQDINLIRPVKSSQIGNIDTRKLNVIRLNFGAENWFKKFRIWLGVLGMLGIIRNSDIVHCHDVFFWYLPFRFLFPNKKVFTTFHGYETKFPPTATAKFVRKISEKLSRRNICIGKYIEKWYGTKSDFITYGGVSTVQSLKSKVKNFGKNRKSMNILLLGRLEEDNGVKIYLEALRKLKNRGISYKLTVCGDGNYRRQFGRYGNVHGFVNNLNKYIDRADFIFASSYLSILEAFLRSKKVFSVYQNELKRDYLTLSPFAKYVSVAGDSETLASQVVSSISGGKVPYNKPAYFWARKQTWSRVADIYLKLWKL